MLLSIFVVVVVSILATGTLKELSEQILNLFGRKMLIVEAIDFYFKFKLR